MSNSKTIITNILDKRFSIKRQEGLHPNLKMVTERILVGMDALGFPVMVTAGVRTAIEQKALYDQGRTKPGNIVTYADGYRKKSNHQRHDSDGFGHAVDIVFLSPDGKPSWEHIWPWKLLGELGKAYGLKWGGDWENLKDLPHFEYKGDV